MLFNHHTKSAAFVHLELWHFKCEIQCEKIPATPIATARKRLSNDDKLAIIKASKCSGFNREEAMKKWGIRRTQMYEFLKNKKCWKPIMRLMKKNFESQVN